jgi:hypothetical protein
MHEASPRVPAHQWCMGWVMTMGANQHMTGGADVIARPRSK